MGFSSDTILLAVIRVVAVLPLLVSGGIVLNYVLRRMRHRRVSRRGRSIAAFSFCSMFVFAAFALFILHEVAAYQPRDEARAAPAFVRASLAKATVRHWQP